MYEPYYTDDEVESASDYESEHDEFEDEEMHEAYFIGKYNDTCDICAEAILDNVLSPRPPEYFEGKILQRRYTRHEDDEEHPYPYKHILCQDCCWIQYGDHETIAEEEYELQKIHKNAVDIISDWVLQMKKRQKAKQVIKEWFLEVRYNPKYKYCRKRVDALYDEEY